MGAPLPVKARAGAVSLPPSVVSALKPIWAERYSDAHGWDGRVSAYVVAPGAPPEDVARAIATLEAWAQPAPMREIVGLLGELKLLTSSRAAAQDDLDAQLALYARKLEAYPAAVVRDVLRRQPERSKWWPSWAELAAELDERSERNRLALDALRRARDGVDAPQLTHRPKPPQPLTDAQRAAVAAKAREVAAACRAAPPPPPAANAGPIAARACPTPSRPPSEVAAEARAMFGRPEAQEAQADDA